MAERARLLRIFGSQACRKTPCMTCAGTAAAACRFDEQVFEPTRLRLETRCGFNSLLLTQTDVLDNALVVLVP